MILFACPNCHKSYRFFEKSAGNKFECKCGQRLQVPFPNEAPTNKTAMGVLGGPAAPAAPAAPVKVPKKKWYYEYQGNPVGPVDEKDLRVAAENDTLKQDARVWTDGMLDWQPAIAALPRVFEGLEEGEAAWGFLKTAAVILGTCAVASVIALGGIYAFHGRKGETKKSEAENPLQAERAPSGWKV